MTRLYSIFDSGRQICQALVVEPSEDPVSQLRVAEAVGYVPDQMTLVRDAVQLDDVLSRLQFDRVHSSVVG